MKGKVISIVLTILLLICGGMVICVVTKRTESSTLTAENTGQQMTASGEVDDQKILDKTTMSDEMHAPLDSQETEESSAAPTATPEATKQPEATAVPTAAPKATKQPEATAAPTATPKATKQPEATAAPTGTPEATAQPEATAAPTGTPEATVQPEATAAPTATPVPTVTEPPAQVHTCTWDGGSVTQEATCSSEGVKTYTCTSCGSTRTEGIAKADHSYVTETTPASCTEYGQDRTYCSVCGYEKSRTANSDAPKGHQATDYRVSFGSLGSTCTHPGTYDIYCSACGECVQREVPREPLGHDLQNPVVVQVAGCTVVEITEYTCGRCGEKIRQQTRDTDPNNHDWEEREKRVDDPNDWENFEGILVKYYECKECHIQRYD